MNSDTLFGSKAIAAYLGISDRTVRDQVSFGRIPVYRIGRYICARKSTLNAWIAEQERKHLGRAA